jgi:hypothetical protein
MIMWSDLKWVGIFIAAFVAIGLLVGLMKLILPANTQYRKNLLDSTSIMGPKLARIPIIQNSDGTYSV